MLAYCRQASRRFCWTWQRHALRTCAQRLPGCGIILKGGVPRVDNLLPDKCFLPRGRSCEIDRAHSRCCKNCFLFELLFMAPLIRGYLNGRRTATVYSRCSWAGERNSVQCRLVCFSSSSPCATIIVSRLPIFHGSGIQICHPFKQGNQINIAIF